MAKKRPTLDSFLNSHVEAVINEQSQPVLRLPVPKAKRVAAVKQPVAQPVVEEPAVSQRKVDKHEIVRHMLYLPLPVYDQLQGLIFEEQRGQAKRRKTHNYLLDAIDLLFKEKGLKSIMELTAKEIS